MGARGLLFLFGLVLLGLSDVHQASAAHEQNGGSPMKMVIELPKPRMQGGCSLEEVLSARRSVREYIVQALSLGQVAQLMWAAQGITHGDGYRTAPSAGALYPLELYLVSGRVKGLSPGVYHYLPRQHGLERTSDKDVRSALARAALGQPWVKSSAVVIVFAAVESRTAAKYGQRARRYVDIEVGHAAENVALQAVALGLGSSVVGAFDDAEVAHVLDLGPSEQPLYLMPLGVPHRPYVCKETHD